jgi:hypothetical protein
VRNPEQDTPGKMDIVRDEDPELVYASDVQILAEPGGVQLTFLRPRPAAGDIDRSSPEQDATAEVIARVVLPPLAARRLLRLLPRRLLLQQDLAEEYARATEAELESDPFLAALAEAEYDDEPYTDEQRAAAQAGWEEYQRGETVSWEEFRRELREEEDTSKVSAP